MATYYISGIWQSGEHVTHVVIHAITANKTINTGQKLTRAQVINLINGGHSVYTMRWAYDGNHWNLGSAIVGIYPLNGVNYIRTHKDATEKDNLDNMLPMNSLGC